MNIEESPSRLDYTLRFPFKLATGRRISGLEKPFERKVGDRTFILENHDPYFVIKVMGFLSEKAASEYAASVWGGLAWILLCRGIGFIAVRELEKVVSIDDPYLAGENLSKCFGIKNDGPIHGLVNLGFPSVYQSHKVIRALSVGNVSAIVETPSDDFFSLFTEGISQPNSSKITSDPKLTTALELYAAYFYERSPNARLLTLVMALEALTESQSKHALALDLIRQWDKQVEVLRPTFPINSEEYYALEALQRELLFRKDASLRSSIRSLVLRTLEAINHPDAMDLANRAMEVYDTRSKLVHEGKIPAEELSNAENDIRKITELVLKAKFQLGKNS